MRISEYPQADKVNSNDVLVVETSEGTKKILAKTLTGDALAAYPVGAIYMSYNSTSPASLFGGSWVQITSGYLKAAAGNGTGGSSSITLTTANMPKHSHGMRLNWYDKVSSSYYVLAAGSSRCGGAKGNNTAAAGIDLGNISQGSGTAVTINPPYQNVYVWRRTA